MLGDASARRPGMPAFPDPESSARITERKPEFNGAWPALSRWNWRRYRPAGAREISRAGSRISGRNRAVPSARNPGYCAIPRCSGRARGSSPWMFTTMSQFSADAISATRSVPERWSVRVKRATAPKRRASERMRSSSVAMMVRVRYRACEARSHTCWSIDFEEIWERTLPGKRVEAKRAGITPRILRGTGDHITKPL